MTLGLLLGGGGTVGIAWELGVLAGLGEGCGFGIDDCDVIVGTSAGSAVGAEFALGKRPAESLSGASDVDLPQIPPLEREKGAFAEIIKLLMSGEARTPEGAASVGHLAMEAETAVTEEQFVSMFRRVGDAWPVFDLRLTATNCATGARQVWTASDGIDLKRAVASSCAIPGFFPPVSFQGEHYMDSARGPNYHAAVLEDVDLGAALYIGPKVQVQGMEQRIRDDIAVIAERGVRTHIIMGSDRLDSAQLNLMDVSKRHEGYEIGVADGLDNAPTVGELLGRS